MDRFWGLFNGSKFYRLRAQYRRELFEQASAIVLKNDIIIELETSTKLLLLTPTDTHILNTQKDPLNIIKAHYLAGTIGAFELNGQWIHLERKGLRFFTDTLAEHKARFESNYAMDLIPPETSAIWIAEFFIGVAMSALFGVPVWLAVLGSALTSIVNIMLEIQAIGNNAASQALTYITYTQALETHQAQARLESLGGRKAVQEGALEIYKGYSHYANGQGYKAYSPGSETYLPSQPYAPSHLQTKPPQDQSTQNLKALDEQTQGRAHYELGGNEGFLQKINPQIPLAQAQDPQNDIVFRQNTLNNNSQDLRKILHELAKYLGSTKEYSASDYLQAVYNFNFALKEEQYQTYVQSKDFINQSRRYNHALRANALAYSKHLTQKHASQETQTSTTKRLPKPRATPHRHSNPSRASRIHTARATKEFNNFGT